MAHELNPNGSDHQVRITDEDGDSVLATRLLLDGGGLVLNATGADDDMRVDVLLAPADLDALLDIIPTGVLRDALVRKQDPGASSN